MAARSAAENAARDYIARGWAAVPIMRGTKRPLRSEQIARVVTGFHPAVVALEVIFTRTDVNDDWQEIVCSKNFGSIKLSAVFRPSFLEKAVTGLQ